VNFSIQKSESHTTIRVNNGKLDALLAPGLKSELVAIVEKGEKNILVDLSSCSLCDSSGLSALLLGDRLCKGVSGTLVLVGLSVPIRELMDLVALEAILKIVDSEEEAAELFL